MIPTAFLLSATLLGTGGASPAQRTIELGTWHELAPPTRVAHSAVYDHVRKRMIVFGGRELLPSAESWVLSLEDHATWSLLPTGGSTPPPRLEHGAIYDPVGDRVIIYGGRWFGSNGDSLYDDVWALSLSRAPTWLPMRPSGTAPPPRSGQSAIYDASLLRLSQAGRSQTLKVCVVR